MPSVSATEIRKTFRSLGDSEIAQHSQRFFKTGKGEYGEGDQFLGIRVPVVRKLVRRFDGASDATILAILRSRWHEERLFAVISLAQRFAAADEANKRKIYDAYLRNVDKVNNWDLVDSSAHLIVGPWLERRSRKRLRQMARSPHLWTRRIAVMATLHFIRLEEYDDTLAICEILLQDEHDLIHKASGWMLREVGKRNRAVGEAFLAQHYREMPRTMLRYAIEHLPKTRRKAYLTGRV